MTSAASTIPHLRFAGVRKSYGGTSAVAGLSLDANAGEIFGLIGPDGAGKTTAMRIACALLLPDAGTVAMLGHDVVTSPQSVKRHVGYMPQRFSLYGDLTVAENIRFFADMYDVPSAQRREQEERLMQFSRLAPFRGRRAAQLSGGMKQKLALSCTLIHTPEVLILDEPTTGVDPLSRQEFWAILKQLAADGHALLVSTPYMDEAELCDRVALMHHGQALAAGTPGEIKAGFTRRLLEITGQDALTALRRLTQKRNELAVSVNRFGDRIHIVYDEDRQRENVLSLLRGLDMSARHVEPDIEDVFVERMEREERTA
ncbi:MAG: ABC transporter ATP-binding protein [bacterium]|nr:ABC transporter ATP-binding protein [bacterium]